MTDYANERQANTHKLYAKCVHMNKFDEKYFQLFYLGSSLCRNVDFFHLHMRRLFLFGVYGFNLTVGDSNLTSSLKK